MVVTIVTAEDSAARAAPPVRSTHRSRRDSVRDTAFAARTAPKVTRISGTAKASAPTLIPTTGSSSGSRTKSPNTPVTSGLFEGGGITPAPSGLKFSSSASVAARRGEPHCEQLGGSTVVEDASRDHPQKAHWWYVRDATSRISALRCGTLRVYRVPRDPGQEGDTICGPRCRAGGRRNARPGTAGRRRTAGARDPAARGGEHDHGAGVRALRGERRLRRPRSELLRPAQRIRALALSQGAARAAAGAGGRGGEHGDPGGGGHDRARSGRRAACVRHRPRRADDRGAARVRDRGRAGRGAPLPDGDPAPRG